MWYKIMNTTSVSSVLDTLRLATGPTAPAVLADLAGVALVDLMVLVADHPLIAVDLRGFLQHTFSTLIEVINEEVVAGTVDLVAFGTKHLAGRSDRTAFIEHLQTVADRNMLHLFTPKTGTKHMHAKQCTQYNVYDAGSMATAIERQGIEGISIEAMYKEYSTAYTDLAALIDAGTVFVNEMQAYAMSAVLPLEAI